MSIHVQLIKNKPVESNCYVISHEGQKNCIIIDPGEEKGEQLFDFLNERKLTPEFIILTHEHFDHIWGVNKLKEHYNVNLICSRYCSEKITTQKGNLSVFNDQVGFITCPADILAEEINYELQWDTIPVKFISTPGHTGGCICIDLDNNLFTGDFIIKGVKTNTKLPGSSSTALIKSLETVFSFYHGKNIRVFPGHGEPFYFQEIETALEFAMK
jgi:hydroxyacylglutathione hydrolase